MVTLQDITGRKRAEQALQVSEARYRTLFENNIDAVFMTIPDGTTAAANPAACAMFGMTEEELCRLGRLGLCDLADPRLAPALEQRRSTGRFRGELSFIRKDGTKFETDVNSVILPSDEAKSFVILRDITERKRAEAALLRSEKLASVGRLAASVSHEINNPLEAAMNSLYLARTIAGAEIPEAARTYLDVAEEELKRIAHITRQSLRFYREPSAPGIVSPGAILDSLIDLLQSKIKAKRAVIEKQYDGDLEITAAAGELRQLFSNLLVNSLDALDDRGTIKLRFSKLNSLDRGHPSLRITVADNGKGMDAATLSHLFEPFFTTKETIGVGLGLWVSKQIVEKHHGSIRVHSRTNGAHRGTAFSIFLPVEGGPRC